MDFRTHKKYINGVFKTKAEIEELLISEGRSKIYKALSFGGGTQSTHLLEEHFKGNIHYDLIIMSDTGAEPDFIHNQVAWWQQRQKEYGNTTPFIITHHNSMEGGIEEMAMRWILTDYQRFQLPVYCSTVDDDGQVKAAGLMPRQCTVDFKIIPVKQQIRRIIMAEHGLADRQRFPGNVGVMIDIGFSADEIRRINVCQSPQYKYMYLAYPLVEENLSTQDSIDFLIHNEMPSKRSRCYLCPFNCDMKGMDWQEIIDDEPLSFLKAVWFDDKFREVQAEGWKNMRSIPSLHFSRRPLREVYQNTYNRLYNRLGHDIKIWRLEWEQRINQKYRK